MRDFFRIAGKLVEKLNRRDVHLQSVRAASVVREWNSLSALYTHAQKVWGLLLPQNPFCLIKRPASNQSRDRRITPDDAAAIVAALGYTPGSRPKLQRELVAWCFLFAMETAMRAGEILKLQLDDVAGKLATLRDTKNGHDRTVPLSVAARELLALVDLPLSSGTLDALFR